MSKAFRIWLGSRSDSAALARLHAPAFEDAWPAQAFESLLARDGVAVFLGSRQLTGEAEGFLMTRSIADEAEVLTFCVVESARKSGLGRALLHAAERFLRERDTVKIFLEVSEANVPALKLYQQVGFSTVGRRAAYYQHGLGASDALIMRKLLNTDVLPSNTGMDYKGA